jgi:hypothetical protein
MKQYIIPVGNEEISEAVQLALFSAGFAWGMGDETVRNTDGHFLCVNFNSNKNLSYGNESVFHTRIVREEGVILISSQEVIKNPFALEGAKNPVKEMTVAQLEEKLGHPVKVIK